MIAPFIRPFQASLILVSLLYCTSSSGSTLPTGFSDERLAMGLDGTCVTWAPDGRIFVAQKKGIISIIKNGALLPVPFLDMQPLVDNLNERGLQSVTLDPQFHLNGYVYVYYAVKGENRNRVSRFSSSGDRADEDSELVLVDLDVITATIHNGGALFFKGGKLFIGTGDGGTSARAQSSSSLMGKILRINPDGSIPEDNPFYASLTGNFRLIYATGLRNPFTAAVQPGTERVFINDVGKSKWEEVNELAEGRNYGWPLIEGPRTTEPLPENYQDPLYAYPHTEGCSIVGATFYNPQNPSFPSKYHGKYFFGDYCKGYIKVLDPDTGEIIETFATNISRPISFTVAANGDFYYLSRGGLGGSSTDANTESCCSEIWKVRHTGSSVPSISAHPTSVEAASGEKVSFVAAASGQAPLEYQWQRDRVDIPGATSSSYEIPSVSSEDNGAKFRIVVSNAFGSATSNEATLTVSENSAPSVEILTPAEDFLYTAGTTLSFSGAATDVEDGTLPPEAYTWEIVFHHDTHTHPAMPPAHGITEGEYPLASDHEPAPDVWYRIYLTVEDGDGNETTVFRDVHPVVADLTLTSNPPGLNLLLDGSPITTPYTFSGVAGISRAIEAPESHVIEGVTYYFRTWSDGGAIAHEISTPSVSTTITATYTPAATPVVNITNPEDGQSFTAPASVSIDADATISEGGIVKVEFYNGTTKLGEDDTSPYSFSWNDVGEGSYSLVAKAIDQNGASSTASVEIIVFPDPTTAVDKMASEGNGNELQIYPNPASKSVPELRISGLNGLSSGSEGTIEIYRITGEVVYAAKFACGFDCADYSLTLSRDFAPGVYMVNVMAEGIKASRRLFVK